MYHSSTDGNFNCDGALDDLRVGAKCLYTWTAGDTHRVRRELIITISTMAIEFLYDTEENAVQVALEM